MEETECVFCKIVKRKIKCPIIFENERFIAFLDINPVNFGHALIVPKEHIETLLTAKSRILREMMPIAKRIADAVMKNQKAGGFNLCMNNYRAAGQLIPHLHLHIIPRYDADFVTLDKQKTKKYLPGELEKLSSELKRILKEDK